MKHLVKTAALCVCLALLAVCSAQAQTDAKVDPEKKIKGHKVIRINKMTGLDPKLVMINSGTTIIWMNHSDSLAEIQFRGKQVTIACKNPTNFVVDEEGSFISNRIPQGAVASLCFLEKGTYNYVLKRGPRTTASVRTDLPDVHGSIVVE
jgi:hypothetical protein